MMTGNELIAILLFGFFCMILILKPAFILNLYAKTLKLFSMDLSFTERTELLIRIIGVLVLLIGMYGMYQTFK